MVGPAACGRIGTVRYLVRFPHRVEPPPPPRFFPPCVSTKACKVMTKSILHKTYREIVFQKVALCYLLHFVQNGSSNSILKQICLHSNLTNLKITRPSFRLGAQQKHVKLLQIRFYINYIGNSSSRKLRWVMYYTVYIMDPQETY